MTRHNVVRKYLYKDDIMEVKSRFPNIEPKDFFHIATKTNPLVQLEAYLRGKSKKK